MNIGQQIRKYRERDEYSQEYLAEKLYVSRQTISNWENEKSYPDIHNLLVMCELFDISLDDLVRGDLNSNKQESIKRKMNIWSLVMIIGFTLSSMLIGPILYYFNLWGFIIIAILFLISFYSSTQIDKIKYKYNLDNYDRIVAFMNGKDPNEVKSSEKRNLFTSILSFIFIVGLFLCMCYLSIYLTEIFLKY